MEEKIWIYVLSKTLSLEDLKDFNASLEVFLKNWTAHELKLEATYQLISERVLIVKVNEKKYNASGCSIDKLQRFILEAEKKYNVELLNRLNVAYQINDSFEVIHSSKVKEMLANKVLDENSMVVDVTLSHSSELKDLTKPIHKTWLKKYLD